MIAISDTQFSVEVYLLCLKLIDSRDNSRSVIRLSKKVWPLISINYSGFLIRMTLVMLFLSGSLYSRLLLMSYIKKYALSKD